VQSGDESERVGGAENSSNAEMDKDLYANAGEAADTHVSTGSHAFGILSTHIDLV